LKSQYEQAEKELNELLRPYLQQHFENKSSDWGVQGKQDACIKQRYYYDKRIEELRSAYYQRKSTVDKIADKLKNVTSGELNADKLKRIQDYIIEIKENYIPQKNNLTSIKSGLDNLITSLQLIDCNFIDIKVIPEALIGECWLSENFFYLRDEIENLSDEQQEAFFLWCEYGSHNLASEEASNLLSKFRDAYCGKYNSEEDYVYEYVEDCYELPEFAKTYFDYEKFANELFSTDYWYKDGFVFRR